MKNLRYPFAALIACVIFSQSCSKSSGNFVTTDHTPGLIKARGWYGSADGYAPGDTTKGGIIHHNWPDHFSRTITDSSFSIIKIDGYTINMMGLKMPYRITDSTAKFVRFDTSSSILTAALVYYYAKDSISFGLHRADSFSTAANQYYQLNLTLHTQ
jgi:hypothetical protein